MKKILNIYSDWKWTGPSENIVHLCKLLSREHNVTLLCGTRKLEGRSIIERTMKRNFEIPQDINMVRSSNPFKFIKTMLSLRSFITSENYDIIIVNQFHDLALLKCALLLCKNHPKLVYINHKGREFSSSKFTYSLLNNVYCYLNYSQLSLKREENLLKKSGIKIIKHIIPFVEEDIFELADKVERENFRQNHKIGKEDVLFGIVARVQKHRRFDILLKAFKKALGETKGIKLMVIGRGTLINELAITPAKELGIFDDVIFTGYLKGSYSTALKALDAFIYLVPGSDGTARSVREAMASGLPLITTDIGMLSEYNKDNATGLTSKLDINDLASCIIKIATHPELRNEFSKASYDFAESNFNKSKSQEMIIELFKEI